MIDAPALEPLVAFYAETGRNLRYSLAALQSAAEYAAEDGAERIGQGHMRAATADWRERTPIAVGQP